MGLCRTLRRRPRLRGIRKESRQSPLDLLIRSLIVSEESGRALSQIITTPRAAYADSSLISEAVRRSLDPAMSSIEDRQQVRKRLLVARTANDQ